MRVLMVFSQYRQPGGEERSTHTEADLLRSAGHTVEVLNITSPLSVGRDLTTALGRVDPDVVHVQNFFPFLQPRHYRAIRDAGRPTVQSLRNYRLTCISANHWRDDAPCHECAFDRSAPGIRHSCYRTSRGQSIVAAGLLARHRKQDTWASYVSAFVAVSEKVRDTVAPFVGSTPIHVKPNTVVTDVIGDGAAGDVVYVGRISSEKGIVELAEAWSADASLPLLTVVGDGPQRGEVDRIAARTANVRYRGQVPHDEALALMGAALATIAPWRWDEPFGRAVMESLAVGTPVIASPAAAARFAGLAEAIAPWTPTDPQSLGAAVAGFRGDTGHWRSLARADFERSFAPATVLARLEAIYHEVLAS